MLRVPERHRADLGGKVVDVNNVELADMLSHVRGFDDYDVWVKIGMALHHECEGDDTGFELWDDFAMSALPNLVRKVSEVAEPVKLLQPGG